MEAMLSSLFLRTSLLLASITSLGAFYDLSPDQLKQLQAPGGWDYIKMTGSQMRTDHACFDGVPHPDTCTGRLTLAADNKFTQEVKIQGQVVARHGTYTLDNDQLTFFDELETSDGPYTIELDAQQKSLVLYTSAVRIELILHRALHRRKETK